MENWRYIVTTRRTPLFGAEAIFDASRLAPDQAERQAIARAEEIADAAGEVATVSEIDSPHVPDRTVYRAKPRTRRGA